jgi:uncharacterized DUF497 family protein
MWIEYDEQKRQSALKKRGLDFGDTGRIFNGPTLTQLDDRHDYPEPRLQTYGLLDERLVIFAWTPVLDGIRVFSMRRCNDREYRKFAARLG